MEERRLMLLENRVQRRIFVRNEVILAWVTVALQETKRLIDLQDKRQACLYKALNRLLESLGVR
jgi:BarA-like signal transduction histidine kinase